MSVLFNICAPLEGTYTLKDTYGNLKTYTFNKELCLCDNKAIYRINICQEYFRDHYIFRPKLLSFIMKYRNCPYLPSCGYYPDCIGATICPFCKKRSCEGCRCFDVLDEYLLENPSGEEKMNELSWSVLDENDY